MRLSASYATRRAAATRRRGWPDASVFIVSLLCLCGCVGLVAGSLLRTSISVGRWTVTLGVPVLCVQLAATREWQRSQDDSWYMGSEWLHCGCGFTGTFIRRNTVNVHGMYHWCDVPVVALFLLLSGIVFVAWWPTVLCRYRRRLGLCERCGYTLHDWTMRCSECGVETRQRPR